MVVSSRVARTLALTIALAALALVIAMAGNAMATTKNGITPLAPKAGTSVPARKSPVFHMRVKGRGEVWVNVCRSRKKNAEGVICLKGSGQSAEFEGDSIGRAKKKTSGFEYKPKFYDYPSFWLNTPGTYYWQAYRIYCVGQDCRQEGPVVRFRVK